MKAALAKKVDIDLGYRSGDKLMRRAPLSSRDGASMSNVASCI